MRLKALDKRGVSSGTLGVMVIVLIAAIIFMPFAVIWALNTLFNLGIAYGFYEWLAVLVMSMFFQARVSKNDN